VALGQETFVPDSVIRDTRRGTWIATYPARAFLARKRLPSHSAGLSRAEPPRRGIWFTPVLTLVCISVSVTIAFWDLFH
jgi:hypothetical protein